MIGGNLLASYLEKEIDRKIAQKVKELEEQYPDPEPNDSALKLEAILLKEFGLGLIDKTDGQGVFKFGDYMGYHPDFDGSHDEFEKIKESLDQYIHNQISKPNDEIEPPPEELQNYLESKADALNKVQNHVLNSELPKLNTVFETIYLLKGDYSVVSPLDSPEFTNFQKILALDILEKQRQGKNQEAREMLEVSWRISQLLKNYSFITGKSLALTIGEFQTGVIRKLDNLSPYWQERLLEHDYPLSILKTIEEWHLSLYNVTRNLDLYRDTSVLTLLSSSNPLSTSYLRLSAVDYYGTMTDELEGLPTRNVCSPEEKVIPNLAWWNLLDNSMRIWIISANEELRAAKYMLELEFTQKILQVKELAKKQGKWPDSIPNLDSKFCPDRQYIYKVSEDGTMTISLDKQPEWVKDRDLPLIYSDRTPPQ
ncbi:hypothetical protein CYANOKiyG1_68790 [Okeania sp. KiyG1]|nr:hypothetical protein CYANOKiyG1_68790 [Okeania sp. KiyG1]